MRALKRIRGNKSYFYLQQSLRKNGKVITKEKYLGTSIPENIMSRKESFKKELQKDLFQKFSIVQKGFWQNWSRLPETVKEKELEEIAIAFTYNTNAIEGSTITLAETREIVHSNLSPHKSLRDVQETQAHSRLFLSILKEKQLVTKELLLAWHIALFGQTKPDIAGTFRDYLVRVGDYVAPDWQDVESLLNLLTRFIAKNKLHPIELAALVHYRFEKIHPFGDGNGRIGRLLMNYLLWHHHYPMLIIEFKKRNSYYAALRRDEDGFVQYFFRRYLAVHKSKV
ncbi:MAG: Fic family protein [Candidatus Woesearchaeota archaeon]|nr:Fic family protein [Candidatus Woesearchaeota archaeon]